MATVMSPLKRFEGPNLFEPLKPENDEAITDVETPEEILERVKRSSSETIHSQEVDPVLVFKKRSFEMEDLSSEWTIVSNKRRNKPKPDIEEQIQTPNTQIQEDVEEVEVEAGTPEGKAGKPRRWRRSLFALGTAAAVGLASLFIRRRLAKQQS